MQKIFTLLFVVTMLSLVFSACGKDNEPEFDNYTIVKDWKNDPLKGSFDSEEEREEYIEKIKEIILNGQLRKQEQPND